MHCNTSITPSATFYLTSSEEEAGYFYGDVWPPFNYFTSNKPQSGLYRIVDGELYRIVDLLKPTTFCEGEA